MSTKTQTRANTARDFVIADCELTTGAIAALTGAKLREGDPVDRPIRNIAPLDAAGASDISFLDNSKYATELATTRAAACLIAPRFVERAPTHSAGDGAAIPGFRRRHPQTIRQLAAADATVRRDRARSERPNRSHRAP